MAKRRGTKGKKRKVLSKQEKELKKKGYSLRYINFNSYPSAKRDAEWYRKGREKWKHARVVNRGSHFPIYVKGKRRKR